MAGKRWLRGYIAAPGQVPHFFLVKPEGAKKRKQNRRRLYYWRGSEEEEEA